jgi:hypothetical protein
VTSVAIRLEADEWLAAWNEATSRLLLRLPSAPRTGEVAVRVQLAGKAAAATVVGAAVGVEHRARDVLVELAPDDASLRAVHLLCAAARGEPLRFLDRPLRYLVKLPVVVFWSGGRLPTSTLSISEGGCALRWPGRLPTAGQELNLSLGVGARAYGLRGVVCWTAASAGSSRAGLRLLPLQRGRDVWRGLLADAERSGAATG